MDNTERTVEAMLNDAASARTTLDRVDQEERNWRAARGTVGQLLELFDGLVSDVRKLSTARNDLTGIVQQLESTLEERRSAQNRQLTKEAEARQRELQSAITELEQQVLTLVEQKNKFEGDVRAIKAEITLEETTLRRLNGEKQALDEYFRMADEKRAELARTLGVAQA